MKKEKPCFSLKCVVKKTLILAGMFSTLLLSACLDEPSNEPADELSPELYESLKDSILAELIKSQGSADFNDSLFEALYDSFYESEFTQLEEGYQSKIDSLNTKQRASDSLNLLALQESKDSLYDELYDDIYTQIYSSSASNYLSFQYRAISNIAPASYLNQKRLYPSDPTIAKAIRLVGTNLNAYQNYDLMVEIKAPGLFQPFTQTFRLPSYDSKTQYLHPHLDYEKISGLKSDKIISVQANVYVIKNDLNILVYSQTDDITLLPPNKNGGYYVGNDEQAQNDIFAHWVQPKSSVIDSLIIIAKNKHPLKKLVGYQNDGVNTQANNIQAQVKAVYDALHTLGITYVISGNSDLSGQTIQFPAQTLRSQSANCIDGTVLFASVLERIGIETRILTPPGHALIGWREWKDSNSWQYLETTLWGSDNFSYAISSGNSTYNTEVSNGNLANGVSFISSVFEARNNGIAPWPYDE